MSNISESGKMLNGKTFMRKLKLEYEDCPECGNKLTIFCVVPLEGTSEIVFKRFCPRCEHIWSIQS